MLKRLFFNPLIYLFIFVFSCESCDKKLIADTSLGCTDIQACNYNSLAIEDDNSCEYETLFYYDGNLNGIACKNLSLSICQENKPEKYIINSNLSSDLEECLCEDELDDCGVCGGNNYSCTGCMIEEALNYDIEAFIPCNNCCILDSEEIYGCTNDSIGNNADINNQCLDQTLSSGLEVDACPNNGYLASNFNPASTLDDGSCEFNGVTVFVDKIENENISIFLSSDIFLYDFSFEIVANDEVADYSVDSVLTSDFLDEEQIKSISLKIIDNYSFLVSWISNTDNFLTAKSGNLLTLKTSDIDTEKNFGLKNVVFYNENNEIIENVYIGSNYQIDYYYNLELPISGISQAFIFKESITSLDIGDEIGVFDLKGILNSGECNDISGNVLVGTGVWNDKVLAISAIGSINNCNLGGSQIAGWISGNQIIIKVWKRSELKEYVTSIEYEIGTGIFGDPLISIQEINLIQ